MLGAFKERPVAHETLPWPSRRLAPRNRGDGSSLRFTEFRSQSRITSEGCGFRDSGHGENRRVAATGYGSARPLGRPSYLCPESRRPFLRTRLRGCPGSLVPDGIVASVW